MHIHGQFLARRRSRAFRPACDRFDDRCLLSALTPAQVTAAYALNSITFTSPSGSVVTGDGRGETIALIEAYNDPFITSDLQTFDATFGLPDPIINVVNQAGQASDDGWALEESLDVEWAHAIAPGANILVVEASSQSLPALVTAINTARNTPGVVAVSMSWGFSEFRKETAFNSTFMTPSGHAGITFIASSGDDGFGGGPEWPSTAPAVVAVGGTTLYVDSAGNYQLELPWAGSGGGYSRIEPEPGYQRSVQGTGGKSTPDVAFDGDPNSGVLVYQTSVVTGLGSWEIVGGTSLGTPAWAGIIALADQGRNLAGLGSLDGATQTLPALYALPSSAFNIVGTSGTRGRASAGATANTYTGRGTPVGPAVIAGLVADNSSIPLTTSTYVQRPVKRNVNIRARKLTALAIGENTGTLHSAGSRHAVTNIETHHRRSL
jgi:subtilase family serine protease